MADQIFTPSDATILMVDDNLTNIRLLADMLMSRGYQIIQAINGPDALQLAREQGPDLVLLDIFMPKMDGYEVCRKLKANADTRDIPVMFISALSETSNIVHGFEIGGVDYITKPFQYREVIARVQNQLTLTYQRRQIEALRAQDRQYFESLNRMKDQFIRMATHDLRNPLNVILGYTHVLDKLEVAESDRGLREQVSSNIRISVDKMRTLVTDLLDLAQLEMGMQLSFTWVSLADFLATCLSSFHILASQEKVDLIYDPPPDDIRVELDENYMTRVIDNLVSNAIKYTPEGGRVSVTACVEDDDVVIEVSDTGLGIPVEDLPHLFDPFYRVRQDEHQGVEGSGLGLSIVKTIVDQHNGAIQVDSTVGQGSTFRVILPVG